MDVEDGTADAVVAPMVEMCPSPPLLIAAVVLVAVRSVFKPAIPVRIDDVVGAAELVRLLVEL